MSIFKTTLCSHCGAAIQAFRGTAWDNLETRAGAERDHCPSCKLPYDLERLEWQEWSSSGQLKTQFRAVSGLVASVMGVVLFVVIACGFVSPKGLWGVAREAYGLAFLVLLTAVGLCVALRHLGRLRGKSFHRLAAEDSLKTEAEAKWRPEPEVPKWETGPSVEGIRGMPSRPPASRLPDSVWAPPPLEEVARRIASAFLRPGADPEVMERLRVLSESTCQWPPMRPAEADRKLGELTMTGDDDTRAYVTIREDGRGHLSLLRRDGVERVVRFQYAIKRRRRPPTGSKPAHIRKSSPR